MKVVLPTLQEMRDHQISLQQAIYEIVFSNDSGYISFCVDFSNDVSEEFQTIECVYLGETFYRSMKLTDFSNAKNAVLRKINEIESTKHTKVESYNWYK